MNEGDQRRSKTAYPVSPAIGEDELKEIGSLEAVVLAPGIVVLKNAFQMDENLVLDYIDSESEAAHRNRWTWVTGDDGERYGINEDGFKYEEKDVPCTPIRILAPVNPNSTEQIKDFFIYLEDQIYKSLLKYIDHYPLMLGSIWWKTRGHILRYGDGGVLGCHADNDTNYKVSKGIRYMPRGMMASRQTCGALVYFNDCVESEEELNGKNFMGGHLNFVHLGVSYVPKKGDIIFFPTNYLAAHEVGKMGDGVRYTYLTFFGQGSSEPATNILISEADESFEWCPPVWMDNIYDDYELYCRSPFSMYSNLNIEKSGVQMGWNPIYQVRSVVQYAETSNVESIEKSNDKQDASSNEQMIGKACDGQPEVNIQYVNKVS
jgi:hypothetical protein